MGKRSKTVPFTASWKSANAHLVESIMERVLPNTIITPHLHPTLLNKGSQSLQTPVEGTAIHAGNWGILDGRESRRQLFGLTFTVSRKRWVGGDL